MTSSENTPPASRERADLSRRGLLTAGTAAAAGAAGVVTAAGARAATTTATTTTAGAAGEAPDVGFVLSHEQFPAQDLVRYAAAAEKAGFADVWASDHFQPWQDNQGHAMYPWNTLSLVAASTRRLRYGTA